MADLDLVSIKALGQANDGSYQIDLNNVIYEIEDNTKLVIKENAYVRLLDRTQNKQIEVIVNEGATLEYYIINSNSNHKFNVSGELRILEVSLDETKEDFEVVLTKENATCDIKNLSILDSKKSYYNQKIIHNEKETFSNITNIGIAINGASITFDTTGKIEKGKNKSKCQQLSRGIVMDNDSVIVAKPILLIDEFDCFANHGASIGKMSDEDLFYLMSRGLTKNEAFLLILQGIINPYLASIPREEIRNALQEEINNRTR